MEGRAGIELVSLDVERVRGASRMIVRLQDDDLMTGVCQKGGGAEPTDARADDDNVSVDGDVSAGGGGGGGRWPLWYP